MLTSNLAPAVTWAAGGPSTDHMSSQTEIPTGTPPIIQTADGSLPEAKYRASSKTP